MNWRRAARFVAGIPLSLRLVLLFAAVLHGACLSWGMPASDGWDVDGVAPRDILPGLAETYTWGHFYTYPPLQLALLALLTLPVTVIAILKSGNFSVPAVIHEIIQPPYMTAVAMTARIATLLMSLSVVYGFAMMAEELAPKREKERAAAFAGLLVALDAPFTYYAHATNLDVPYLCWSSFAMLSLVRAVNRNEPRRLRKALVLAALAVATKDQAYAMFLLGIPVVLFLMRARYKEVARELAIGGSIALSLLLVIDGALVNPTGFHARLAFLSGPASQDFATYSKDLEGRWAVLVDSAKIFTRHYPSIVALPIAFGLFVVLRAKRVAAVVPFALAVSFTLCFNMVARRVEERFTLLQVLVLALFGGIGFARLWGLSGWFGRVASAAILVPAVYQAVVVDATLWQEPRYAAERWIREHATPGDVLEEHGLNVYLARFPSWVRVQRVGRDAPAKRNPMPDTEEVQADLAAIETRKPRFIVVNECFYWRYVRFDLAQENGRIVPTTQVRAATDPDGTAFFKGLLEGRYAYRLAFHSTITSTLFPNYRIHASTGCPVSVFERRD